MGTDNDNLTERQKKWFASVQASMERDTGKTIDEWVAIARTTPATTPRARTDWLRTEHGLGINRASYVLSVAFPGGAGWDQPEELKTALWIDPASAAILAALDAQAMALEGTVRGQRKGFTAFSRKVQYAAARPVKGGRAMIGFAVDPDSAGALEPRGSEGWSERLKAKRLIASPSEVDAGIEGLLTAAWTRS